MFLSNKDNISSLPYRNSARGYRDPALEDDDDPDTDKLAASSAGATVLRSHSGPNFKDSVIFVVLGGGDVDNNKNTWIFMCFVKEIELVEQ